MDFHGCPLVNYQLLKMAHLWLIYLLDMLIFRDFPLVMLVYQRVNHL